MHLIFIIMDPPHLSALESSVCFLINEKVTEAQIKARDRTWMANWEQFLGQDLTSRAQAILPNLAYYYPFPQTV